MPNITFIKNIAESDYLLVENRLFALSLLLKNNYPLTNSLVINRVITREILSNFCHDFQRLNINNYHNLQGFCQEKEREINSYIFSNDFELNLRKEIKKLNTKLLVCSYSFVENHQAISGLNRLLKIETIVINSQNIMEGIKQIFRNLFNAKIVFYCQKMGINYQDINFSILIESIDDCFATGWVDIKDSLITIQANYGLINSILKGEVLPDYYEIDSQSGTIIKQLLGKKSIYYQVAKNDKLEFQLLEEEQQNQYCLNNSLLNKLIQLTKKIIEFNKNYSKFEFLIRNNEVIIKDILYINQQLEKVSQNKEKLEINLKGIPASNGKIYGEIQVISGYNYHFQTVETGKILVTKNITPDWFPVLKKAAGLITEEGGITSHGSIMSRELGIPAIVGVKNATQLLKTGEYIIIDGNTGNIYYDFQGIKKEENLLRENVQITQLKINKLQTKIKTKLLVNLSESSLIERVINLPIDGIGLMRADFILLGLINDLKLGSNELLEEENKLILFDKWVNLLVKFAKSFAPKPIFYRSLDWLNIKDLTELDVLSENRGTLSYFSEDSWFKFELEILAKVQSLGYSNINLILPFVRSVEEFIYCRNLVSEYGLNRYNSFKLLIMAEVPSVIFLLPEYIKNGVQGISIGTNDLSQLLLGISRKKQVNNHINSALLLAIKQLIYQAKKEGIYTSICGNIINQYPHLIHDLIDWGIDGISVDLEAVEKTFQAILTKEKKITKAK